jgi:hypothetical protein
MTLALSVMDNGNSTVGLTVTGSTAPGTVSAALFTGQEGALAWSTVWSFSADGTSPPITVAPGHYVWAAFAGPAVSPPVYQSVVDPTPALAEQCLRQVAARIQLLALPRIGSRVYVRADALDANLSYPCVVVYPPAEGEVPGPDGGTNARSDWEHPIRVSVMDRKHPSQGDAILPSFAGWRQQILRAFDREALPGIAGGALLQTVVEPGPVMRFYATAPGKEYSLAATELTIRCLARQPRGFGT